MKTRAVEEADELRKQLSVVEKAKRTLLHRAQYALFVH